LIILIILWGQYKFTQQRSENLEYHFSGYYVFFRKKQKNYSLKESKQIATAKFSDDEKSRTPVEYISLKLSFI
jgi:hypothetical protein